MKYTFVVDMSRTEEDETEFEVEASSPEEAREKIMDMIDADRDFDEWEEIHVRRKPKKVNP